MNERFNLIRILVVIVFVCLAICLPDKAHAGCSATSGVADLGSTSSFAIVPSSQTAEGATGFTCTGSLLSIASTNTITATIASASNSLGSQPRLFNAASGDYVAYEICKNFSCSSTYAVGNQMTWSDTTFVDILGLFNATDGSLPIYVRTVPGTHVAAGSYTSTITLNWSWHLCAAGALGACIYDNGTATSSVSVIMIVEADCMISTPPVNFGIAAFVGGFDPVTQTLTIRCSKGAGYSVGIDSGQNFAGTRRLNYGSNNISYEIYFPQGSNSRWGHLGAERRSSAEASVNAGLYTGTSSQVFTYRAEILAGQSTPPPGIYTDTLVVDVQF